MAKQISKTVEVATAPFQHALKTKAGCECVAHVLQTLTDLDPEATVISIDGVGVYDLITRNAMLEDEGRRSDPPLREMFLRQPIHILWEDEMGVTQSIPQGEGGEQGDPLMPLSQFLVRIWQQQGWRHRVGQRLQMVRSRLRRKWIENQGSPSWLAAHCHSSNHTVFNLSAVSDHDFSPSEQARVRSQGGPLSSVVFACF